MKMVAEHRIGQAIDGKDRCQEFKAVANPGAAMFVALVAVRIGSTEERSPNAAVDTVDYLSFFRIEIFASSLPGHIAGLLPCGSHRNTKRLA